MVADACRPAGADERVHNVARTVGHGEDTPAALDLQRNAASLKESPGVLRVEAGQGAVQEAGVRQYVPQKLLAVAVVGDVAPPLSGDAELAAGAVSALQKEHAAVRLTRGLQGLGGGDCRHHAGGTGADNQHARSVGHTLISPSAVDSGLLSYTS